MNEETINNFGKGAFHAVDVRDYIFGATPLEPFDWSKSYNFNVPITPSNQQQSLSCVGQTTMNIAKISWFASKGTMEDFSARFIYSQIYQPGGGAYGVDGLRKLADLGICKNIDYPSDPQTETHMEDRTGLGQVSDKAKAFDIYNGTGFGYAIVGNTIEDIAVAIREHGSVMLLMNGDNAGWSKPDIEYNSYVWGHAITGVQPIIRNGKKIIKFLNSWNGWGDNGYGYLDQTYIDKGGLMAVYVMTDNFIIPQPTMKLVITPDNEQWIIGIDNRADHIANVSTLHELFNRGFISSLDPEHVNVVDASGNDFLIFPRD